MKHPMLPPGPGRSDDGPRLFLAVALSLAILFGFHHFYEKPRIAAQLKNATAPATTSVPAAHASSAPATAPPSTPVATPRLPFDNGRISGSIALRGARLDELFILGHAAAVASPDPVRLLSPAGDARAYYIEGGWATADSALHLPDSGTLWRVAPGSAAKLAPGAPVTLQWDNGQGLVFSRRFELDERYLFTVTQTVTNATSTTKTLSPWSLISRHGRPVDYQGFFILHEGPLARLNGKLEEPQYNDLDKGKSFTHVGARGWLGITDKYWFVGLLPPPAAAFDARILGHRDGGRSSYQTDITGAAQTLSPGGRIEDVTRIFAGVKDIHVMQAYQDAYGLERLDLTFDFGMWYFITKPFFFLLHFLMSALGNVGLAILAMTVIIRAAVFPLASKSFRSMAGMKKIAPILKELQEKYGDNREKLQQEIFELYRRENVNPFSGCWPILVQIPIFFALYKSILLSVELRHAPFWGWIHDLSAPDPTNLFTLFGLVPWSPPPFLVIGAWPVLFCLTMIVQKRLSPPMADKTQEALQSYFPFIITFMLAHFASGLVIYWTWSNVLGVLQQYYIMRKMGGEDVSLVRGHVERRKKRKASDG